MERRAFQQADATYRASGPGSKHPFCLCSQVTPITAHKATRHALISHLEKGTRFHLQLRLPLGMSRLVSLRRFNRIGDETVLPVKKKVYNARKTTGGIYLSMKAKQWAKHP